MTTVLKSYLLGISRVEKVYLLSGIAMLKVINLGEPEEDG